MNKFKLSRRSLDKLKGVHPDLISVVKRAIELTEVDFVVIEGLRTLERQKELVKKGASQTINSRHLTGHAVDLGAWVDNKISWNWAYYYKIADAMKQASQELNIPIEWGGDWKTFKDGPHYQLPWAYNPEIKKEAVKCQDTKHSLLRCLSQFLARWKLSTTRSS